MAILQQYSDLLLRGRVSVGYTYFTGLAKMDIAPGSASLAPLRVTPGTLLSSTVSGAVENDGAKLYWTDSNGVRSSLLTDKNYYQFGMSVLQASRLTTGRYIGLGGGVVAEAALFNGDTDLILQVSSVNADYLVGSVPIDALPTGTTSSTVALGNHTHLYAGSATAGGPATTALACTGNAATATKLATARTISLTGSVTGSGSFDGSGDVSITTTTNHIHSYLPLSGGTLTGGLSGTTGSFSGSLSATSGKFNAYGTDEGGTFISAPGGGRFVTQTSSYTGYIKITLPVSWSSTMIRFVVDLFNYSGGSSASYFISGYNYNSTNPNWVNYKAYSIGSSYSSLANLKVHFGHDGEKCCIYLGESNTSYSYPQIAVRDILVGFSSYSYATWSSGWSVGITTTLGTITGTVTNPNIAYSVRSVANALTVGTGISLNSGTTYDGSSAKTISINQGFTPTWTGEHIFSGGLSGTSATFSGLVTAGSFSGVGSSITSLNASNLSSGTVPIGRLPTGTTLQALRTDASGTALEWYTTQWQYGQYGTGSIKTNAATATGLRSGDESKPYVYWAALSGQDLKAGGIAGADQKWMLISPSTVATYAYGGVEYTYHNATANYVFLLLIDSADFIGSATNPFNRCRIIANAGTNYLFNYRTILTVGSPITGNVYPVIVSTGGSTAPSGITYTEAVSLYAPLKSSSTNYTGNYSVASGAISVASGYSSVASGESSVASGYLSVAYGYHSVASGTISVASGSFSVASGYHSVASGQYSIASGYHSVASGQYSIASGSSSVASGSSSVASGLYSVASGSGAVASGDCSFASGNYSVASGHFSVASGRSSIASGESQTVIGKYNVANTSSAFIIGNGTSTSARSNCLTVSFDGDVVLRDTIGRNTTLAGTLTLSTLAGADRIAYFDSTGKLQSSASYTLLDFASASHNHDATYLKLSGGTLTGSLSSTGTFTSGLGFILNVGDSDRYLTFNYTVSAGYSWRLGYLGSGDGEANYLTIESSQTSGAFTRAVQYGLISLDATHFGNILPATGVSKSLGSSTQKWSSVYASSFSGAYLVNNFGGSWIHGKTAEDCVLGNVQQSTSSYHVMMRVTSASGNVWNVGGLNDIIGFYGYYAATTENRTDWATVWDTSTGALTHNKALAVTGATVLSSTLSVSSTVTFTSLSTAGVVHNSAAGVLSTGKVALGSEVSGILGVGNGGTGATTFTANGVLYGNGTGAVQATPAATVAGQFLVAGSDLKPVFSTVSVASGDHNHDATYLKLDGSSYMNGMLGYHVGNSYSFTNDGSYFEVLSIGPITGFVKIKASNPSTQANMIIRIDYYSYELKGYYVIAGLMYGPTKSWLSGSVLFKSNNLLPNVRLTYSVSQGHCVLLGNSSTVLNSQTNSSTPFIITVRHCHGAMFSAAPNWVITRESTEETWLYDQVYSTYNTGLSSDLLDGQHGSYYLNASNLNAGTVPFARLPTGTASDKVATGNHNHDTVYYRYVKNFTTNEDINTAGELGFYKNPGVTSVGIPTGASSYGTLLNLALPSYYGVQFYVTEGRIVYCRISNTVGGFSDWSTMWSSVNSNSTSYDWSAKNLTLAGTISGATTVTATTFSGSGASLTNLPAVSLTGQVSVANGGTGRASLTANYLLYGDGVNSVGMLAIGGANTFLKSTGSGYEWASIRKNDSSEITTLSTTKATPTAITYASGDNKVYHLQCMASSADQVFYVNLPDLANVVSGDKLEFTLTKTSGTYDAQVVFNPNTSSDIFRLGSSTTIAGTTERVRIGTGEAIVFYALYSGQAGLSWRVMRYVDMEV